MRLLYRSAIAAGCAAMLAAWVVDARAAAPHVDYDRQIRPILSNVCYTCHGPDKDNRKAGLRLDQKNVALSELESGDTAIVPGHPEKSALVERITNADPDERMPPPKHDKHLTPAQIALLKQWIAEGAPWQKHWAFVAPERPALPAVKRPAWCRNAIDRFILARLEQEGLRPAPEADKRTLLRRVTLDLSGLPPTPEDVAAFLADSSPAAYEKVVDRLLASPRYGEHMARYWLDAARYADTHGLHFDNVRAIWPYRDWVIRAFNKNMRFDEFTIEQLAGDLLPHPTTDQLTATGFTRCHVTTNEGGSILEEVYVRNTLDRVETTSEVFLGLTAGCAVCHDHKFDPLKRKEFYALFAFFNSTTENALDGNRAAYKPVIRVPDPQQQKQLDQFDSQIAALRQQIKAELAKIEQRPPVESAAPVGLTAPAGPVAPVGLVSAVYSQPVGIVSRAARESSDPLAAFSTWKRRAGGGKNSALPAEVRAALRLDADHRNGDQQRQLREYYVQYVSPETRELFEPLNRQLVALDKRRTQLEQSLPQTLVLRERAEPRPAYDLERGQYDKRGDKVERGVPAFLPPLPKCGRTPNRLDLARWLVAPNQPLTARVTVNRFWQQYFGVGIVKTAGDFGSQGEWPSHPELLDYLATEFVGSGWDVKRLQKLIVMSATYRQSSVVTPELYERDPENRLLSRGPRFRLDAETVRDTALAVSGLLVEKLGGPPVKPYQPDGLWQAVAYSASDTRIYKRDSGESLYRRSIYTFWKRTAPPPEMVTFDAPSRETCSLRRPRTNTPLQALVLMNDVQFVEPARHLAERMMTEGGATLEGRAARGFLLATCRPPKPDEARVLVRVYQQQLAEFRQSPAAAHKLLSTGDSPVNQSLDAGELAAWTMVANLILNLDETITKG